MDMAKRSSKSSKSTGRRSPMVPKAGITRDSKRRYSCGGKLVKK